MKPSLCFAGTMVVCSLWAANAAAQIVKPNILIIFDTSGSMEYDSSGIGTGGDGSSVCSFTGSTSRAALLKKGMRDGLSKVGGDEVNFGLLSFPMKMDPTVSPICDVCCGLYDPGKTYFGHFYIDNPDGDYGCAITNWTLAGNPTTYSASWFDPGINQALRVDVTKATVGTKPVAGDFDPPDGNLPKVFKWIDDYEDAGSGATLNDPELHAIGATPLGNSLFYARLYFENFILPVDPKSCRKNLIILVTDGAETCGGSPVTEASNLYNNLGIPVYVITDTSTGSANDSIASNGGTTSAIRISLTDSAAVASNLISIIAKSVPPSESCNCVDDNCDGVIDNPWLAQKGTPCSVGKGICKKDGIWGCDGTGGGLACIAAGAPSLCGQAKLNPGTPTAETCNGLDDDCNGAIDDGISGGCTCVPSTEVCDGKDNDCDGKTDKADTDAPLPGVGDACGSSIGECEPGTLDCVGGKLSCSGGKGPATEICNGKDDNCNGSTDETDPASGAKCYPTGMVGCSLVSDTCEGLCRFGANVCQSGTLTCKFYQGPAMEKCNGLDDDCDGETDEDFGVGGECDNGGIGTCKKTGTYVCSPDGKATCTAPPGGGSSEVCNGVDDDCDGETDEEDPLPGEGLPCGVSIGECMTGTTECMDGMIVCKGGKGPGMEICDGKDNNCNGIVDEGVPGEGESCLCPELDPAKAGVGECKPGKTVCRGDKGLVCEGCVTPTAEICDGKDNDCDGVPDTAAPCPDGYGCRGGGCAEECKPGEFACPPGLKCDDGYCVPEKCAGVDCKGLPCVDGKCVDPCETKTCTGKNQTCIGGVCHDCYTDGCPKAGERCVGGECKGDPCADVECRLDEFCNMGTCLPTCDNVKCAPGERCVSGQCKVDACVGVACAANEFCDPDTGTCKFNPCKTVQCMRGFTCFPKSGACEEDPCEFVFCSRECQRCEVTPDGTPECVTPVTCQLPPSRHLASGGGGGCVCGLEPGAGAPGVPAAFGLALLGVLSAARSRRDRLARGRR